jgi:glycosyltransferase involved in cell wall biosynthesis
VPTVSVIVPNYNHAPYLRRRIDSILMQTYQDFELILLDDCSTDNSREVLLTYKANPKVAQIVFNEQNSGTTFKQWNKGIELAQGEYIWIAESDDWAEPTFLETLIAEFELNKMVGLVYCQSKLIDNTEKVTFSNESNNLGEKKVYSGTEFLRKKLLFDNAIWNASMMMFKKSLYPDNEHQKLYSSMKFCGDWFFYVLLAIRGIEIVEIKKTLNSYRVHPQNVSTNALAKGVGFLEGLNIYMYLKTNSLLLNAKKFDILWGSHYCHDKRRDHFSKQTQSAILSKLKKEHKLVYLSYCLFEPYYKLKDRIK